MTESAHLAQLLRGSEARARAIQAAAIDAIVLMDHEGRFLDFNPAAEAMFGYTRAEVLGKPIADFIVPERLRESHRLSMTRYIATGAGPVVNHRIELPALKANGEEFPAEVAIVPIEGEADPVFVGFIRDISARKLAEQRQAFLLAEVSHRSKNLLAVVQAIIHRTLKDHPPEDARKIIDRRIAALARSHDGLAADPIGASLGRIVAGEIEGFSNRVAANGPDIALKASAAQTLSLIVHELATNATKHGALAHDGGRVSIRWSVTDAEPSLFVFEWRESGGRPVAAPTRSGFGRNVLEQIAAAEFGTAPLIAFAAEGLHYRIEAPLALMVGD
jgi:PAS domain S-box-containing protein